MVGYLFALNGPMLVSCLAQKKAHIGPLFQPKWDQLKSRLQKPSWDIMVCPSWAYMKQYRAILD